MAKKNEGIDASSPIIDEFKAANRNLNGEFKVYCDTFKLEAGSMIKNIGIGTSEKQRNLVSLEHCHIYHTYDSNGIKQTRTNYVGGHYHEVKVNVDKNGNFVCECSPPIQQPGSEKILASDNHKHEVTYLKSGVVEVRKASAEALKAYSALLSDKSMSGIASVER